MSTCSSPSKFIGGSPRARCHKWAAATSYSDSNEGEAVDGSGRRSASAISLMTILEILAKRYVTISKNNIKKILALL